MAAGSLLYLIIVFSLGAIAVSWLYFWSIQRSANVLKSWARKNGHQLISFEHRSLSKGPFGWRTSTGDTIFRIVVMGSDSWPKKGWARVCSLRLGSMPDLITVLWDKPIDGPPGFPVVMRDEKKD